MQTIRTISSDSIPFTTTVGLVLEALDSAEFSISCLDELQGRRWNLTEERVRELEDYIEESDRITRRCMRRV